MRFFKTSKNSTVISLKRGERDVKEPKTWKHDKIKPWSPFIEAKHLTNQALRTVPAYCAT